MVSSPGKLLEQGSGRKAGVNSRNRTRLAASAAWKEKRSIRPKRNRQSGEKRDSSTAKKEGTFIVKDSKYIKEGNFQHSFLSRKMDYEKGWGKPPCTRVRGRGRCSSVVRGPLSGEESRERGDALPYSLKALQVEGVKDVATAEVALKGGSLVAVGVERIGEN